MVFEKENEYWGIVIGIISGAVVTFLVALLLL